MSVVRLVCWKEDLARERARVLKDAGIAVDASPLNPGGGIKQFRAKPLAAILIDLERLPSHGREVAVSLRNSKWTRHIPIVFAGGLEEKVARIRQELPDAFFTDWKKVAGVVRKALKSGPVDPVQPVPHMQRYAGSSLVKKLGFKPKTKAALLGSPQGFEEALGELPEGAATTLPDIGTWRRSPDAFQLRLGRRAGKPQSHLSERDPIRLNQHRLVAQTGLKSGR